MPGADRLYKLTIDAGEERQIVAGIKPYYSKEELVGKRIVIVANLEPRALRGIIRTACSWPPPARTSRPWSSSRRTKISLTAALSLKAPPSGGFALS